MSKTCTIIVVLVLMTAFAQAEEPGGVREFLTTERCIAHSPAELLYEASKAGVEVGCQTCTDYFYAVYAERLSGIVDARYPESKRLRGPLIEAIKNVDGALAQVTGGNWYGHELQRIPGQVEWILLQIGNGELKSRRDGGKGYSAEDLKRLILLLARARSDESDEAFDKWIAQAITPRLIQAMEHLRRIESLVDPATALAIRGLLIRRVAGFLGD